MRNYMHIYGVVNMNKYYKELPYYGMVFCMTYLSNMSIIEFISL